MPNRRKIEEHRMNMGMEPYWCTFKVEGPTIEEILQTKPPTPKLVKKLETKKATIKRMNQEFEVEYNDYEWQPHGYAHEGKVPPHSKQLIWTKERGWEEVDEKPVQKHRRSNG